jgi:hypothetical protein
LGAATEALADIGLDGLLTAFVAVYAIDVRVRSEDYDLFPAAHE